MRELFIYYRLRSENAAAAEAVVHEFQATLRRQHPQLIARLLQGADATGTNRTWMETYSIDPRRDAVGITAAMQADIEREAGALRPWLDGSRHTEAFVACAS